MTVRRIVVPIVVDGVQERVALNLGRAARKVVDIVSLERDEIVGAVEEETPVCVCVAVGRVTRGAVKVVVRDGDARVGLGAEDEMLAADERGL